ncbi:MAG: tetrahydrofolate synthase [Treponema sp.]|nr:tetrahydrofolate synthase [Treponema sp.]
MNGGKSFSSSIEVFSWLSRFIAVGIIKDASLDRMKLLVELAGHPERCAPVIHVAGSKGKGSVTGMIAAMFEAAGYRPARYLSPHVNDFRERIGGGSSFFDEAVYCAAGEEIRELVERRLPGVPGGLPDSAPGGAGKPTFFELLTLYFFLCARQGGCDVLVIETGIGGRLDPTSVVDPLVSVITLIELEHTGMLGTTIAAVAGEKAGIVKPGKPLVLARQCSEALGMFVQNTVEKHSPLIYFPEITDIGNLKIHTEGTDFTLRLKPVSGLGCRRGIDFPTPSFYPLNISIPTPGAVYAENAGLAVAALKTAFPHIGGDTVRRGLGSFRLPAHFEKVFQNPPVIVDGAHTPESIRVCTETFCALYGEGGILIFSCGMDKNTAAMAEILLPHFSRIIITTPGSFKTSDPEKIYTIFTTALVKQSLSKAIQDKVLLVPQTEEAIRKAMNSSLEKNLPILCTGSFYLASEMYRTLPILEKDERPV